MRRSSLTLLGVVVVLVGCGARTSLDVDENEGGGGSQNEGGGGSNVGPSVCPAFGDATVDITQTVQFMGNIASAGCSFGATWAENQNGSVMIVATTFQVVDGTWQSSAVVTLGPQGGANNTPEITWDGSSYVIAWVDERLFLQRMTEEGTLVGAPVSSFEAPGNVYLHWLQPAPDGSLRIGISSDTGGGGYELFFARVTGDGGVAVPPVQLTSAENTDIVGFAGGQGTNTVLWTTRIAQDSDVVSTTFDDAGNIVAETNPLLTLPDLFVSRHGAVELDGETYFSVLRYGEPGELIFGRATDSFAPIGGAIGGDVPVVAATQNGLIGIVARKERSTAYEELELSVVDGDTITSTIGVPIATTSYTYVMAGGEEAFGILAATQTGLAFTARRP
ncbi:MAG: hypothetical protein HOW73_34020 [Polyangiaceae bacterium]|nr:hypothetical protein [Polyangiaceae bacterium]